MWTGVWSIWSRWLKVLISCKNWFSINKYIFYCFPQIQFVVANPAFVCNLCAYGNFDFLPHFLLLKYLHVYKRGFMLINKKKSNSTSFIYLYRKCCWLILRIYFLISVWEFTEKFWIAKELSFCHKLWFSNSYNLKTPFS